VCLVGDLAPPSHPNIGGVAPRSKLFCYVLVIWTDGWDVRLYNVAILTTREDKSILPPNEQCDNDWLGPWLESKQQRGLVTMHALWPSLYECPITFQTSSRRPLACLRPGSLSVWSCMPAKVAFASVGLAVSSCPLQDHKQQGPNVSASSR
jgi:hypothetical protein